METHSSGPIRFSLIDSKKYRLMKYLMGGIFISTYVLTFFLERPGILMVLLVLLGITSGVYLFILTPRLGKIGEFSIDNDHIVIALFNKQPLIFPVLSVEELKISRGATIHYDDFGNIPPDKNDNWISFTYQNKPYKFEFRLRNKKENEVFESIIKGLSQSYSGFYYESI